MSDGQPEVRWAPLPEKPRHRGRIWLIVILAVLAVAAVVVFVVLLTSNRPDSAPATAEPRPSASVSLSPSPSPSQTPSPTATPTSAPSASAAPTPPPVEEPSDDAFSRAVTPVLDDAQRGLGFAAEDGGEAGAEGVLLLIQDAQRLADAPAPSDISGQWSSAVSTYIDALNTLQSAYRSGDGVSGADGAARSALSELRALAGG